MDPVAITVQNLSSVINDAQAQAIARALHLQATSDYNNSCWVTQDLAQPVSSVTFLAKGAVLPPHTWHIELLDTSPEEGALGFHEDIAFDNKLNGKNSSIAGPTELPRKASTHSARGLRADAPMIPLSKVFCKTAQEDGASASECASHEMLEMLVDPQVMTSVRTVVNPDTNQRVIVEVGDPVQECGYTVGGILLADFALPAWFRLPQIVNPTQMSFRGSVKSPFELAPGGYISVAPVGTESWTQIFGNAGTTGAQAGPAVPKKSTDEIKHLMTQAIGEADNVLRMLHHVIYGHEAGNAERDIAGMKDHLLSEIGRARGEIAEWRPSSE